MKALARFLVRLLLAGVGSLIAFIFLGIPFWEADGDTAIAVGIGPAAPVIMILLLLQRFGLRPFWVHLTWCLCTALVGTAALALDPRRGEGAGMLTIISFLILGAMAGGLMMITLFPWAPRTKPGHCSRCGYDLKGTPSDSPCSECGQPSNAHRPARGYISTELVDVLPLILAFVVVLVGAISASAWALNADSARREGIVVCGLLAATAAFSFWRGRSNPLLRR